MPTLRQIREEYYISRKELAELSGVSESTLVRVEDPAHRTRYDVVMRVLKALSGRTGQQFTLENVEGLNLYNVMRDRRQRGKAQESPETTEEAA